MSQQCLVQNFQEFLKQYGQQCSEGCIAIRELEAEEATYTTKKGYRFSDPSIDTKAELLLARLKIFDMSVLDLDKNFVCRDHARKLTDGWMPASLKHCALDDMHTDEGGNPRKTAADRLLTKQQSKALFCAENKFFPVGCKICPACFQGLQVVERNYFQVG